MHGANAVNTSAVDWLVAAASSAWFSYRSVMSVFVYRKHTKLTVCNLFKDVLPTFAGAAGGKSAISITSYIQLIILTKSEVNRSATRGRGSVGMHT